jgi:predicted enzyme related to lactoylglutathione lyase
MIIWCRDFPRMVEFYERVIGFEVERRSEKSRWVQFNNGEFSFALMEGGAERDGNQFARCPIDPLRGDTWAPYVTVKVEDFDACLARIRESGAPVREWSAERLPEGRLLDVLDPDGNTLALTETSARH